MSNENETLESKLKILQDNVNELETSFNQLCQDINSKLNQCSNCIESTKQLSHQAAKINTDLGNKLVKVSNEEKDIKIKLATTSVKGMVTLNVGGEKYITSVETLTREKDSFFTALFSKQWELERHPDDKSIFIDRNGKIFTYLLEYLRTDMVLNNVWKDETILHSLLIEAQYFRLHSLIELLTYGFFSNGTLLKIEYQIKLNEFYGKVYQRWKLIYKASRHGFDAETFHLLCNNQGPTMTIIQSSNNYLFGGYTSIPWTSKEGYEEDITGFLFTLTNPHNILPTKYLIKPGYVRNAVYHHGGSGPRFGFSSHDIYLATGSNLNNSSCTALGGAYTDTTGRGNVTFTGAFNFTTYDVEVFKLA